MRVMTTLRTWSQRNKGPLPCLGTCKYTINIPTLIINIAILITLLLILLGLRHSTPLPRSSPCVPVVAARTKRTTVVTMGPWPLQAPGVLPPYHCLPHPPHLTNQSPYPTHLTSAHSKITLTAPWTCPKPARCSGHRST